MKFVVAHQQILAVLALALIAAAPKDLPASWRELPAWGWTWLLGTFQIFASFRGPKPPPTSSPAPPKV